MWTYFCRKPDLEESLTVNQDLIDVKIKSIDKEMKEIKKIVDNNRAELKEQLRIQDDYSQRNNVRFDGIPETEKKTGRNQKKIKKVFAWTEELYIERALGVTQNKSNKEVSGDLVKPRTIIAKLLSYKEKEEIMRWAFKFKDTGWLFKRNNFNP